MSGMGEGLPVRRDWPAAGGRAFLERRRAPSPSPSRVLSKLNVRLSTRYHCGITLGAFCCTARVFAYSGSQETQQVNDESMSDVTHIGAYSTGCFKS